MVSHGTSGLKWGVLGFPVQETGKYQRESSGRYKDEEGSRASL